MPKHLFHVTPMPPLKNGIADYAYIVAERLANKYKSYVFCENATPKLPPRTTWRDPSLLAASPEKDVCYLYQIGNNWDHTFALRAALRQPGVVILHDLQLLYLYESLQLPPEEMFAAMLHNNPALAAARAKQFVGNAKLRSDYTIFDMLRDVVTRSKAVVVHTGFAKNVLVRRFGEAVADRIFVIPHFAIPAQAEDRTAARARLGLPDDWFIAVTAGFATRAKRFDLLIDALDQVVSVHRKLLWVQAGPVRPHEYDVEALVAERPRLQQHVRFTGYLSEHQLHGYVAAADVLVNMRFPSSGESSGSLARALSAGAACIVTGTAGYQEIPDSAAMKLSPHAEPDELASLIFGLIEDPSICELYGAGAMKYAQDQLSLASYVDKLTSVIERSFAGADFASGAAETQLDAAVELELPYSQTQPCLLPADVAGRKIRLRLGPIPAREMGFNAIAELAPRNMYVAQAQLEPLLPPLNNPTLFVTLTGYALP